MITTTGSHYNFIYELLRSNRDDYFKLISFKNEFVFLFNNQKLNYIIWDQLVNIECNKTSVGKSTQKTDPTK